MATESTQPQQHWIYVLGGAELLTKAEQWEQRKQQGGKAYSILGGAPGTRPLLAVQPDDILYLLADAVHDGRLGEQALAPEDLARRLEADGLSAAHRSVKIFASGSGDGDAKSFAAQLCASMRPTYADVTVFGYRGNVDPAGFDGHKTAGLDAGESLGDLSREQWLGKGARAKDNRVQFPPAKE